MARSKTRSLLRSALSSTERAHLLRTRPWRITDAPDIAESLADRSIEIRCEAAEALGRLLCKRRRASSALLRAATDRNSLVRTCVAEALGDIGDKAAATVLRRLLRDPHAVVRSYAACSLAVVSGPEAGRALQQALSRDRSSLARVGHYEALASIGQLAYVTQLLDLLRSRRYHVRCATANALARLALPADDRGRAARALREALQHEPTVAARSTMTASLRDVRRRHAR